MRSMITEKKKRIIKTELDGYMTMEASFIIPPVFICFIVIILYTFFLYDHMIVYHSCYLAALRGSQIKNATNDAVKTYVDTQAEKLLEGQVYQYQTDHESGVSLISINVKASSHITNLVSGFNLYKENELKSEREVSINRIDPVDYIRNAERF